MRLWIKDPLAGMPVGAEGGVMVAGGVIEAFVPAGVRPEADAVFEAGAHVVLPGLINTHHHFYQNLTRAYRGAEGRKLFDWLVALYPVWARLDESALRLACRVALAELLLSGCSTAADHHYLFPEGLPHAIDIAFEEAAALGIRVVLSRGSMDLSSDDGGLPPRAVTQRIDTILADGERLVHDWHQRGPGAMSQMALAPCSPFSVTADLMRESAAQAEVLDVRLHTHLAETEDENEFCVAKFGKRPLDYLEDLGWVNDRVWFAHGIHFNRDEMRRMGKAGCCVAHCASSNMSLGSGMCQVAALEAAGVGVGLGVDGSASNDGSNMIQEVRQAMLLARAGGGVAAASVTDAIRWGTSGAARCLGREDIGVIALGAQADFAMFRLEALRFSGADDPMAALLTCGAHRADRVMVGGVWRVVDGAIPGLDLAALMAAHRTAAARMRGG
ncbi:MAG: 8-oxoguanine deaminase [Acidocella sp.]|nr:8-oxoguanine deaminase [Acidocella sp.]